MSQPWIIKIEDATEAEPDVVICGSPLPSGAELSWCDFRELIEQGQRIVEMIDGRKPKEIDL